MRLAIRGLCLFLLSGLACEQEKPAPVCDGSPVLRIAVRPGDYLHVAANQKARDVALTLFDAGGRQLLPVDSLNATSLFPWPAEEIHWVADAPGELRLELTLLEGSRGPCDLRRATLRRATPAERRRALAEVELARGHERRRLGEPASCRTGISLYENAQRRFAELGLPRRRAEALLGLGLLQRKCLKDSEAALEAFIRTEPFFAGDPALEATVRQHLGELRYDLGNLDGAIGEYRQALELRRRLGDRAREALTSTTLGLAVHQRGRYDEAAARFDYALGLWQESDEPGERAQTHLNRGHLHRDLGEADRARERFQEALGLFRQAQYPDGEAAALNALGLLALDQERPGAALEPLRGSLELREPGTRGWAVTQATLGLAYRQLGRLEEARRAYEATLPVFHRVGDSREEARSLGNLGWLEAAAGHDTAALDQFDRALGLFRTMIDPREMARTLTGMAWVLRRRGDLEAARGLMEEALATLEQHRFSQASYTTRAAFFSTQQDTYDLLIDLLMEMHRKRPDAGHAAAALEVNERSLARSLLDGLATSGMDLHRVGTDPVLRASEREIEREIDTLVSLQTYLTQQADVTQQADAPALLRTIEADLRRRWDELDRVRAGLRASDPRYATLTQPQPWSTGEIQRELLDRNTLLLEYRLGEKKSFLWAVTSDSLESFELPGRAAIEKVARQAIALLARRKTDTTTHRPLARLSRMLLEPVAPLLPGKRLLVVGDGVLQTLPFAALPESGGEPLIAGHEIVTLPSVSVLGALRREVAGRTPAPKTLWVLANPDFGDAFKPLPYTREEAAAILELAPAPRRSRVQGRQATRQAVLRGPLHDYQMLHFATHGAFAAAEPGGGRLVLAQVDANGRREANGFLHLADIYELDLRADLVVLSACRSALGPQVRGEGIMGMTRGFFYAGAERVLVSLWNVNDQVTAELMRRFYHGMLVEGLSPAAALRAAQNGIRQQRRWRSPYYWAGFTLQGERR